MAQPILNNPSGPAAQADTGVYPETKESLAWGISPQASWLDYRIWLEVVLDPGLALHKPLPQYATDVDTLASVDWQDPKLDQRTPYPHGINLNSASKSIDAVQRMASSTYTFVLRGWALRAAYQIPIPGLVSIAGADAYPMFPQRATPSRLAGNFCGVPIWFASWELYYSIILPPSVRSTDIPAAGFNPALHIRPDAQLPDAIPLPTCFPDTNHIGVPSGGQTWPTVGPIELVKPLG